MIKLPASSKTELDIVWKYYTMVDSKCSHVCCNFCEHTVWGSVSHFEEHLTKKGGDVVKCTRFPPDMNNAGAPNRVIT